MTDRQKATVHHTSNSPVPLDGGQDWDRSGTFQVASGVHRIPLPLPGDGLKAVNVYAIQLPNEIVLIDSGWALQQARRRLEEGLAAIDADLGMVTRVLVTHIHADHYDLGTHLQREFGSQLALGVGERPSLRCVRDATVGEQHPLARRLRQAGANDLARNFVETLERRVQSGEATEKDWPLPDVWLTADQQLDLADRTLRVVATPGHTQGHVVFVDDASGLLFAGDHVLPHITPSIGFESVAAETALADYLSSLATVRSMDDLTLLPAHGPVRPTTHDRVDELLVHHEARLRECHDAVAKARRTADDVARALRWTLHRRSFEELDLFNRTLAVNETAAHLDVLVRRGELTATTSSGGVRVYTN